MATSLASLMGQTHQAPLSLKSELAMSHSDKHQMDQNALAVFPGIYGNPLRITFPFLNCKYTICHHHHHHDQQYRGLAGCHVAVSQLSRSAGSPSHWHLAMVAINFTLITITTIFTIPTGHFVQVYMLLFHLYTVWLFFSHIILTFDCVTLDWTACCKIPWDAFCKKEKMHWNAAPGIRMHCCVGPHRLEGLSFWRFSEQLWWPSSPSWDHHLSPSSWTATTPVSKSEFLCCRRGWSTLNHLFFTQSPVQFMAIGIINWVSRLRTRIPLSSSNLITDSKFQLFLQISFKFSIIFQEIQGPVRSKYLGWLDKVLKTALFGCPPLHLVLFWFAVCYWVCGDPL